MCDDVEKVKSDFVFYWNVIEKLGVDFFEVLVFEDFFNGVKVVMVVGLCCVIVLNLLIKYLLFERYYLYIELMKEKSLKEVI